MKEKDKEIDNLKNKKKQSANQPTGNSDSTLIKVAIGLSIVAIVMVILDLLVFLRPRKKDR
ncbi:MAG: hypothetical protein MRERC_9c027 [Mycoplasmataceae bacterium RC_NB112A]|nr:MAG: hypothetical protein MRERC_9c027 [Mycoplasmataceae bacterium RC_NB112A]